MILSVGISFQLGKLLLPEEIYDSITSVVINNLINDMTIGTSVTISIPERFIYVIDDYRSFLRKPHYQSIFHIDRDSIAENLQLVDFLEDDTYFNCLTDIIKLNWTQLAVVVYQDFSEHLQQQIYLRLPYQLLPKRKQQDNIFMSQWYVRQAPKSISFKEAGGYNVDLADMNFWAFAEELDSKSSNVNEDNVPDIIINDDENEHDIINNDIIMSHNERQLSIVHRYINRI